MPGPGAGGAVLLGPSTRAATSQSGVLSLLRPLTGEEQRKGQAEPLSLPGSLEKGGLNTGVPLAVPPALALLTPTSATSLLLLALKGQR